MIYIDINFPDIPQNFQQKVFTIKPLSETIQKTVEPVGFSFEKYLKIKNGENSDLNDDVDPNKESNKVEDEEEKRFEKYFRPLNLKNLVPSDWKKQDHYKILGLHLLRHEATLNEIKKAYKIMVIKHHPDKKIKLIGGKDDDSYFKCLNIAYEWLSNPKQRKSYDSVDPEFDNSIPECTPELFFSEFDAAFQRNGRFSEVQPVPRFGDKNSTRKEVEFFYNFWYEFKSWREFSYLDEEDKNKGTNRDHKRWLDKKNKNERVRRKKEETARILKLVDKAFNLDVRIKIFKENERLERELAREQKNQEMKKSSNGTNARSNQNNINYKQNDKRKNNFKNIYRDNFLVKAKQEKFFCDSEKDSSKHIENTHRITKLAENSDIETLKRLTETFSEEIVMDALKSFEESNQFNKNSVSEKQKEKNKINSSKSIHQWTPKENELLMKAIKIYPSGSFNRWTSIFTFIKTRCGSSTLTEKDVVEHFKIKESVVANENKTTQGKKMEKESTWSIQQQKQFEDALRKFGNESGDKKFDKVAKEVMGKTKSDCIARYKEIVAHLKVQRETGSETKVQ